VSHRLRGRSSVHQCSTSCGVGWIRKARQSTFAEALQTFFQSLPTSVDDLGNQRRVNCKFLQVQLIQTAPAPWQNPQRSKLWNQLAHHLYIYADTAHMATTAANVRIILAAVAEAGIGDNAGEE
ncbi:hypothetical protein K439DRAFT_1640838, partial [Ramaria rubella]